MNYFFKIAYKNLIGAGLRSWLNIGVLSFVFVVIVVFDGLIEGWSEQSIHRSIEWEYAQGQLWHPHYDPDDPFSIQDSHGSYTNADSTLVPVLIQKATIYPEGRMKSILLKGIEAEQKLVKIPTQQFDSINAEIPAIVGSRFAKNSNLQVGDRLLLRWRDRNGTFDATEITIACIFSTTVASVDQGQVWIPIKNLWAMSNLQNEATYYLASPNFSHEAIQGKWNFQSQDDLLAEFRELIRIEKLSNSLTYGILLVIALIAIFDTQVLSIFRRQKEIGTYVAMGMTRVEVLRLFTVEGSLYAVFGIALGLVYGIPLFLYLANQGIALPDYYQDIGMNLPTRMIPTFSPSRIGFTAVFLILAATIVSLIPARKIAKMDPVQALKGKLQ